MQPVCALVEDTVRRRRKALTELGFCPGREVQKNKWDTACFLPQASLSALETGLAEPTPGAGEKMVFLLRGKLPDSQRAKIPLWIFILCRGEY